MTLTPSSQRPYLLRAMHEWMTDNDLTPHIVVDAENGPATLPDEHVEDGKIILNVSYAATRNLELGNTTVCFEARFGGVSRSVEVPVAAVLGIYARETGQGMVFSADGERPEPPEGGDQPPRDDRPSGPPVLRVVK